MSDRFRFALSKTTSEHWPAFERLASAFLGDEHGALRTLATPSGDGGRDAILYQPEGDPSVAMQYSVQQDWSSKLRRSAPTLSEKYPKVSVLIYATPLRIGALADDARKSIREDFHIYVDIRDEHYFDERQNRSTTTREESDRYCRLVVEPLLEEAGVLVKTGATLTSHEARAALLYLTLEQTDAQTDRQAYEAVLRRVSPCHPPPNGQ